MIAIQIFDHRKFKKRDQGIPFHLHPIFVELKPFLRKVSLVYTTSLLRTPCNLLAAKPVIYHIFTLGLD